MATASQLRTINPMVLMVFSMLVSYLQLVLVFKVVSPSLLRRPEPTGRLGWCQMDIHVSTGVHCWWHHLNPIKFAIGPAFAPSVTTPALDRRRLGLGPPHTEEAHACTNGDETATRRKGPAKYEKYRNTEIQETNPHTRPPTESKRLNCQSQKRA